MAFVWKDSKDIFKGEGIYHVTFAVEGRLPLLGELVAEFPDVSRPFYRNLTKRVPAVNERGELAMVRLTDFGKAVSDDLNAFERNHPGIKLCRKMVLDDHLHVVLWVQKPSEKSILEILHGFQTGITKIARRMGVWPPKDGLKAFPSRQVGSKDACDAPLEDVPYHVLHKPFVRTLSRKGQKDHMCEYVVLNAYRKYMRREHPDLFTMHKDTEVQGLRFRSMGNHWLLDWPERQVVQCSRSINEEDLQQQLKRTLQHAELGAVTYTAAISKGEQMIARAVREAGWPLVVLLMDGFPPAGSENERYYKPGGVYFDACLNGKLLLLEAYESTYDNLELIARTDATLKAKDEAKGYRYKPLPHDSKRWRMIAGNEMLRMITEAVI